MQLSIKNVSNKVSNKLYHFCNIENIFANIIPDPEIE